MVHDSGIAYCNVAKSYQKAMPTNKQGAVADYNCIDTELDIVYYLEDIPVNNSAEMARWFYDEARVSYRNFDRVGLKKWTIFFEKIDKNFRLRQVVFKLWQVTFKLRQLAFKLQQVALSFGKSL